jgi:electron transport complex protein RnfC
LSKKTFRGGIHPDEYKELTAAKGIRDLPLPQRVVIPLQQHIGAPAKALVKKGDEVATGQVIGEAGGFVSVPVHASLSGKVSAVAKFAHPTLGRALSVIIDSDGQDRTESGQPLPQGETSEEILKRIQAAGVAGMGGATFPTHVKLSPPKDKQIDVLIINGAECEPFLTCDDRLMIEEGEKVRRGITYMQQLLTPKRTIIGIEDNKPDAIASLQKVCAASDVEVLSFPVKYPQGAEKQLINATLGRTVPAGKLPMDVGCVVQNVGTAIAVADAVEAGKPLFERVLTLAGDAANGPGNYRVRIGTLFADIVEQTGGHRTDMRKILMGGPMMGIAQADLAVPVIKGTSGILLFSEAFGGARIEEPCINCGRCVDVCPMGLMPTTIAQFVEYDKPDLAAEYHALDCIECGSCAYICPSHRYLVQYIRQGKRQIIKNRKQAS